MQHFNIPVFIPELACRNRCIYCNQHAITGKRGLPAPKDIVELVDRHLATMPPNPKRVEVAFFGGSFTGLPWQQQQKLLEVVQPYLQSDQVQGIRVSTRPDYIFEEILEKLRSYGVSAIELGAQSLIKEVLERSGRGHTVEDIVRASESIYEHNFELGLQMMTGLPGDDAQGAVSTAQQIIALNAHSTRIYPVLVIRDTPLADMFREQQYQPQPLQTAAELCARLYELFSDAHVKVLRMGLHPSESFYDGESLLAGPFHPAFGELVMSEVWRTRLLKALPDYTGSEIAVFVHPSQLNAAIGHKASNKKLLMHRYGKVLFQTDASLDKNQLYVDHCR